MKKRAFTLLEMVVVLAILATVIGIVALKGQLFKNFHERKELKNIVQLIETGKKIAVSGNIRTQVVFDYDRQKITLFQMQEVVFIPYDSIELEKVKLSRHKTPLETLDFTENGTPVKGGTFFLKFSDKNFKITIRPVTGKVNIYDETTTEGANSR